ncbi:FAD-dependent oxidoreductase [Rubneribacter sp.]|nr:FAD-binding protein [Candidatus Rubneribacter avistercoris]
MDSAKEQARPGITRRGFLKGGTLAALGLAASGLAGCNGEGAAAAAKGNLPESWDAEADVVVIGMGGAGLSAAIAAKMAGAESVMVLEAAPEEECGGTTRVSGDMLMIPDDVEGALAYQTTLNGPYEVEPEFMQAWAEGVVENYAWLTDELGFELGDATAGRPEFPGTEGGESIKTYYVDGICGMSSLWIPLVDKADELGVSFEYNARAVELAHEWETKEVRGVLTEDGRAFKARRGVVMACGGFASNPDMMQNYMASMGCPNAFPLGSPYNVGDGVKMAQRIGADLWHMNSYAAASTCVRAISPDSPIGSIFYAKGYDYIYVNSEGERFMYEETRSVQRHGKQKDKGVWPLLDIPSPSYMIMGGQSGSVDILGDITYMSWPVIMELGCQTNQELIDAGIMFKADTIEELAGKLGFEPEVLAATLKKYNDSVDSGEEDEFGRGTAVYSSYLFNAAKGTDDISGDEHGGESLAIEPFERVRIEGPFYGVEIALGMLNSQGGAKRNGQSQVLDLDGNPIPRLYSAGEFGSIYAYMYNGGGNVSEAVSTGRVAGQGAAALDPWDAE